MKVRPGLIFSVLIAAVMLWALFIARDFPFLARIYPTLSGIFTLIMIILFVVIESVVNGKQEVPRSDSCEVVFDIQAGSNLAASLKVRKGIEAFVWFSTIYLAIWLLGFKIGVVAFMIAYISIRARTRWFVVLISIAILAGILLFFDKGLKVYWPSGLLSNWLGERWPGLF